MAKLSKKAKETLSVDAVRDSIMMTDHLDQFIPDNDKEPFWDGAVYIYENECVHLPKKKPKHCTKLLLIRMSQMQLRLARIYCLSNRFPQKCFFQKWKQPSNHC